MSGQPAMSQQGAAAAISLARPASRRLWVFAALAALALHIGGAAVAIAHLQPADPDDAVGAPAIEIGVELSSPRVEPSDLPAGPDVEASMASPELPEQKVEKKESELPKDTPNETDQADRVVAQNDSREPKQDDPKPTAVETQASPAAVAAEATATPTSEVNPQAIRSVAPVDGTGVAAQRLRTAWQKELLAHLNRHKRYPADRFQKGAEIIVSFALNRTGHVLSASIVRGSGDSAFDEAALAMIRRSDPVPPPPVAIPDEGLTFTLPVVFRVKG